MYGVHHLIKNQIFYFQNFFEHTPDDKYLYYRKWKFYVNEYIKETIKRKMNVNWYQIPIEITNYKSMSDCAGKIIFK